MNGELQSKLINKYPQFFDYLKKYKGPIIPIQFGFECDDGWYVILEILMESIDNHIKCVNDRTIIKNKFYRLLFTKYNKFNNFLYKHKSLRFIYFYLSKLSKKINPEYIKLNNLGLEITQIKEKFGGLRFYYQGGDSNIDGMVTLAEDLSYSTCELCGSTKNVSQSNNGWIYTRCEDCHNKIKKLGIRE